jgi:hypothetical protein
MVGTSYYPKFDALKHYSIFFLGLVRIFVSARFEPLILAPTHGDFMDGKVSNSNNCFTIFECK